MNRLPAKADVSKIAATGKRFDLVDSMVKGLELRVSKNGTKTWSLRYKAGGRPKRFDLGVFGSSENQLTLKAARDAANDLKAAIRTGADPQKAKEDREEQDRASRTVVVAVGGADETVESVALQCIEALKLRPATRREWSRLVKAEIAPAFEGRLAKELTRPEIKAWSRKLAKRNGWIANRAFSLLRRVFSWAASDDVELVGASPLVGMKKPFEDETESERVLTASELRALLQALGALDLRAEGERAAWGMPRGGPVTGREPKDEEQAEGPGAPYVDACRLLLLTGVRRSAVIGAKRGEFEGLDTKTPQWVVPGGAYGRSKNLRPHVVPLSEPALEIVRRRLSLTKGAFLFPVRRLVLAQVNRAYMNAAGGIDSLKIKAQKAGVALDTLLKAKTVEDYRKAVDGLNAAFDLRKQMQEELNTVMDRAMTWDSHFIALLKDTVDRIHGSKLEPWKAHGFRASIATNSRERLKVSGDVVGAILGHKKPGASATRIYDRSELLDEKRAALVAWAAWLDEIKGAKAEAHGAKVLPMRARA